MNLAEAMDEARERLGRQMRPDEMDLLARTSPNFERGLEVLVDAAADPVPGDDEICQRAYEVNARRIAVEGRKKPVSVHDAVDVTDAEPVDMSHLKGEA